MESSEERKHSLRKALKLKERQLYRVWKINEFLLLLLFRNLIRGPFKKKTLLGEGYGIVSPNVILVWMGSAKVTRPFFERDICVLPFQNFQKN